MSSKHLEKIPADDRPDDTQDYIQEQAIASLIDDLAADKSGN